jgi:hypothetical protein
MKKILIVLFLSFLVNLSSFADDADLVNQAKKTCLELGFKENTEKLAECSLEIMTLNISENKKIIIPEEETENVTEVETESIPYFYFTGTAKQRKKHEKKVVRYMKMPEDILCIAYLNNYGVFKKTKQDARMDALHRRSINCNPYMQAAYYDKKIRDHEFAESTRKLIDGLADAEIQKQESIQKNYRALQNSQNKSRNCKYRKIGDTIRETCN